LTPTNLDNIFLNGANIFDSDRKYQSQAIACDGPAEKKLSKQRQSVNKTPYFFSFFKVFCKKNNGYESLL